MTKRWATTTTEISSVSGTQVFSGGTFNILDVHGQLLRNQERDRINDWLSEKGIQFFDPQIHPDTHDVEYDYKIHHRVEVAARRAAKINLYEVSPRTFGGITSLEIALDHFKGQEPTVIYYSDGDPDKDILPAHSVQGHPLFMPDGYQENEVAMLAHYREFIKNANHMRTFIIGLAQQLPTLTITFSQQAQENDIVITPERMHASDLFRAAVKAASGERVFVNFMGGSDIRDLDGNPLFVVPEKPTPMDMKTLLHQYFDY